MERIGEITQDLQSTTKVAEFRGLVYSDNVFICQCIDHFFVSSDLTWELSNQIKGWLYSYVESIDIEI